MNALDKNWHDLPQQSEMPAVAQLDVKEEGGALPPPPQGARPGIMDTIRRCTDFASVLRIGGVLMVLAAMSAFILQDWGEGNDINRYYLLLLQMFLLAGGGFGLSYLLQENKGARAFFGLSVAAVSANMATLGALIFSVVQWGSDLGQYPDFARWQAASDSSLILAVGCGVAAAIPILLFGHMLFARRSYKWLAGAALFANLLLLLPVRDTALLGGVAMLAVLVPLWVVRNRLAVDDTLRTAGGYLSMATLFVPAAIIITRNLWLYEADVALQIILYGLAFGVLHVGRRLLGAGGALSKTVDIASMALAVLLVAPLADVLHVLVADELVVFLCSGVFAAMTLLVALRDGAKKANYIRFAALAVSLSNGAMLFDNGTLLSAVLCVVAGVALYGTGKAIEERLLVVLGALMVFSGIGQQCYRIVAVVDFSSWISLSVLGVSAIIIGSVIERHGAVIKYRFERLVSTQSNKA